MAETLPNIPLAFSPVYEEEPRVRKVKFGDGYEARFKDGLNITAMKTTLSWENRTHPEMAVLMDFFRRHEGSKWFWHVPHGEAAPRKFVCSKWSHTRSRDSSITSPRFDCIAELYQVFDLGN